MKLNRLETYLVAHPWRHWLQARLEAPLLLSLFEGDVGPVPAALEIGCGFGQGIDIIRRRFGAMHVSAIDLDPQMVAAARARHPGCDWLDVRRGNACELAFADNSFDMVFDFAVLHHVPDWQRAVDEVARVLRPGGYFVIEDLYRAAICNPLSRRLFVHPQHNRFDHGDILRQLALAGFEIVKARNLLQLAGMVLARKRTPNN
ncbi:methyltransferase domain-containing protein [Shewanella sp. AS16]|uniref:class I SAM-dependent methyltransferase n=1 Tax=Shewanella sp. AS16 TaxID=2907625 RepID=UPI001F26BCFD|nr:class I SAM-dependent methyltransferase [Shewanella sp. AS16]MCE9688230.1 methyltransferase domain-containing protein [Shewanella sp. AS16]